MLAGVALVLTGKFLALALMRTWAPSGPGSPLPFGWVTVLTVVELAAAGVLLQLPRRYCLPLLVFLFLPARIGKYGWGVCYITVLVGFVWLAVRRYKSPETVGIAVLLFALIPWLLLHGTWGDEWEYLLHLDSIVQDGDLDVLNQLQAGEHFRYGRYVPLLPWFGPGFTEGYMPHSMCFGFLGYLLPGWLLLGRYGVAAMQALAALALWAALRPYLRYCGCKVRGMRWLVLLSVPVVSFTFHIYPELLAAAIVVYLCCQVWSKERFNWLRWALLCALLLWLNIRFLLLAAPLVMLLCLYRLRESMKAGGVIITLTVLLVLLQTPLYHKLPNVGKESEYFSLDIIVGLSGNFFDAEYGVLPYAPIWLLLPLGLLVLWRRRRRQLRDIVLLTMPYFLVMSAYRSFWYGGQAPPARFVTVLFPLWCPLLIAAIPPLQAIGWRRLWRVLLGWTLLATAAITMVPSWRFNVRLDGKNQVLLFLERSTGIKLHALLPSWRALDIFPGDSSVAAHTWGLTAAYAGLWLVMLFLAWRRYGSETEL